MAIPHRQRFSPPRKLIHRLPLRSQGSQLGQDSSETADCRRPFKKSGAGTEWRFRNEANLFADFTVKEA